MGAAVPRVVTSTSASGAQVIDGSLRFSGDSHLTRTPGSAGNEETYTFSFWVKPCDVSSNTNYFFTAGSGGVGGVNNMALNFDLYNRLVFGGYKASDYDVENTEAYHRDTGWYHFVTAVDTTQGAAANRVKFYVNGIEQSKPTSGSPFAQNSTPFFNSNVLHTIGSNAASDFNGYMSQVYMIDGQALGPESFGYTDQLTNTWRPKKYEGAFGTNGFWLPMDGNSQIGKDQSGNGNDWTPVNFGGSNIIPKATGALPILNTVNGGKVATAGVFGSKENQFITVTVQPGSGTAASAFTFDGVERGSLATIRGATITFDTTDATNNTHPFKLSSTNADSSGGTEYTDGVAYYINGSVTTGANYVTNYATGAASGFRGIKWTVPYNSPSPLYYYCTMHTGMGESGRLTSTTDEKKADPYANNVVLALPLVGFANDVSNQINSGSTTKTVTVTNAVTSPVSNFYGGSYYFDATGDYISTGLSSSDFTFGTGSFTVEGWFKYDTKDTYDPGLFQISDAAAGSGTYAGCIYVAAAGSSNRLYVDIGNDWYGYTAAGSYHEEDGVWHHIAIVGDSGTDVRVYIDGILHPLELGVYNNYNIDVATYVTIGKYYSNSDYEFGGYIQDFRVYKGVAKYTKNFIPASADPDILPDTPSGVALSSQLAKVPVTDGAVAFGTWDGPGNPNKYLIVPDSADFTFGSGDFTLEAFVNYTDNTTYSSIITKYQTDNASSSWMFSIYAGLVRFFFMYGSSNLSVTSGLGIPERAWVHCVVTRDGNTIRMFQNGVLVATGDVTGLTMNDSSVSVIIGSDGDTNYDLDGFVSNVRIIKADIPTDYKTSTTTVGEQVFTPPTAPLTNVTNTKLLCCQSPTSPTAAAVTPTTIAVGGDLIATTFNPFTDDINTVMGPPTGYCTLNPLGSAGTLSQGNLVQDGGAATVYATSTMSFSSGKWYAEFDLGDHLYPGIGVCYEANPNAGWMATQPPYYFIYDTSVALNNYPGGPEHFSPLPTTLFSPGMFQVALDVDNGKCWIGYENTWYTDQWATTANPVTGFNATFPSLPSGKDWFFFLYSNDATWTANFGQKPLKYAPPEGFLPPNYANLSSPGVVRPAKFVTATKWTSTGGSSTYDVDCRLAPDLIWHKCYDGSQNNSVFTSILPNSATDAGRLDTSGNSGGQTGWQAYFTGFTHNGYGISSTVSDLNPTAGAKMISYCWKAGGSKGIFNKDGIVYASAADAGLDGGSATPSASSVGTQQGFSIIKVAGSNTASKTFSHGLSQAPTFAIGKLLAVAPSNGLNQDWQVYHKVAMGNTKGLQLNLSTTEETSSALWNDTSPTDTLFSIGASTRWEGNFIMYLWHDVPGLQKFGMYDANGSDTNGPFVYLGFRPAIIMLMCYSGSGENRYIYSDKAGEWQAQQANPNYSPSFLNDNAAANTSTTGYRVDFLSNGFRLRQANGPNTSSPASKYLYAAWAHQPMDNLYGAQSNAY